MNLTPGIVERHTGKYSHASVRCQRHLYQKRTLGAETVKFPVSKTLAALHVPCFPFQP